MSNLLTPKRQHAAVADITIGANGVVLGTPSNPLMVAWNYPATLPDYQKPQALQEGLEE